MGFFRFVFFFSQKEEWFDLLFKVGGKQKFKINLLKCFCCFRSLRNGSECVCE